MTAPSATDPIHASTPVSAGLRPRKRTTTMARPAATMHEPIVTIVRQAPARPRDRPQVATTAYHTYV